MVETMRAQRFYAQDKTIRIEDVPIPHPKEGEVLVKVEYCGICHSDISLINGTFSPKFDVITQGHEASGYIAEIGPGVTGWEVGERVIPSAGRPCGVCRKCRYGDTGNCLDLQIMAFHYDGAWAEYHLAQATGLIRVPENVAMDQAAILADAVSTPFGAVVHTAQVHLGNAVAVWGLGGVGSHVVQLAKLAGAAPIIALDINDATLERAKRLGADFTIRSDSEDVIGQIREITNGRMIDVAFDAVGLQATTKAALDSLDMYGKAVTIGMSAQEINAGTTYSLAHNRKRLMGHLGYKTQDIAILAELLSYGRLDLSESISQVVSLEDVEKGIHALETKEGNPIRILVKP